MASSKPDSEDPPSDATKPDAAIRSVHSLLPIKRSGALAPAAEISVSSVEKSLVTKLSELPVFSFSCAATVSTVSVSSASTQMVSATPAPAFAPAFESPAEVPPLLQPASITAAAVNKTARDLEEILGTAISSQVCSQIPVSPSPLHRPGRKRCSAGAIGR